jgi:hypothetical protein
MSLGSNGVASASDVQMLTQFRLIDDDGMAHECSIQFMRESVPSTWEELRKMSENLLGYKAKRIIFGSDSAVFNKNNKDIKKEILGWLQRADTRRRQVFHCNLARILEITVSSVSEKEEQKKCKMA